MAGVGGRRWYVDLLAQVDVDRWHQLPPTELAVEVAAFNARVLLCAQSGDAEASRVVCARVADHLTSGDPAPDGYCEFVAAGLARIGEGEDPASALSVKRRRGRAPTYEAASRDHEFTVRFEALRAAGLTKEEAIGKLARPESEFALEQALRRLKSRK